MRNILVENIPSINTGVVTFCLQPFTVQIIITHIDITLFCVRILGHQPPVDFGRSSLTAHDFFVHCWQHIMTMAHNDNGNTQVNTQPRGALLSALTHTHRQTLMPNYLRVCMSRECHFGSTTDKKTQFSTPQRFADVCLCLCVFCVCVSVVCIYFLRSRIHSFTFNIRTIFYHR